MGEGGVGGQGERGRQGEDRLERPQGEQAPEPPRKRVVRLPRVGEGGPHREGDEEALISAWFDGEAGLDEAAALDARLDADPDLAAEVEDLRALDRVAREAARAPAVAESEWGSCWEAISARTWGADIAHAEHEEDEAEVRAGPEVRPEDAATSGRPDLDDDQITILCAAPGGPAATNVVALGAAWGFSGSADTPEAEADHALTGTPGSPAEHLSAWIDGELTPLEAARVGARVEADPALAAEVAQLRALDDIARAAALPPAIAAADWGARWKGVAAVTCDAPAEANWSGRSAIGRGASGRSASGLGASGRRASGRFVSARLASGRFVSGRFVSDRLGGGVSGALPAVVIPFPMAMRALAVAAAMLLVASVALPFIARMNVGQGGALVRVAPAAVAKASRRAASAAEDFVSDAPAQVRLRISDAPGANEAHIRSMSVGEGVSPSVIYYEDGSAAVILNEP